jgi:hypothetical protein
LEAEEKNLNSAISAKEEDAMNGNVGTMLKKLSAMGGRRAATIEVFFL